MLTFLPLAATDSPEVMGVLTGFDWVMLLTYLSVTFGIGLYAGLRPQSEAEYFLAGRSTPPIIAAISLFATLFSTTSFVAVPGEAYKHGAMFFLSSIGYAIVTPLAVFLFLRFFYGRGDSSTIYEYLERRFDYRVRTIASIGFLLGRVLWGATALFAGAKLFHAMSGWSYEQTILVMGLFTIAYTTIGGMRGVLWTDVMQTCVIFTGVAIIWATLSHLIGHDYSQMWAFVTDNDRGFGLLAERRFYEFSLTERLSFWQILLVYSLLRPMQDYGTDQLVVQRLLSAKSYEHAKRAVWVKTIMAVPLMGIFYMVGLLLFYYYNGVAVPPAGVEADKVLFYFVTNQLPPPLPGVIAAAALAALMSSISSVISSLATVSSIDLLQRARRTPLTERGKVVLGKCATVAWGAVVLSLAILLASYGKSFETSINEIAQVMLTLWGVLLVIVLAAVLSNWATSNAATWALAIGLVVGIVAPLLLYFLAAPAIDADGESTRRISFGWVGMPGIAVTAALVIIISFFEHAWRGRSRRS